MTMRSTFVLSAATLALACADARSLARQRFRGADLPIATQTSLPSMITPAFVMPFCSDSAEAAALRCSEGAASRAGDTLVIRLSGIGAVRRVDRREPADALVRYLYVGRLGGTTGTAAFHLVEVQSPQLRAVELVNAASGDSTFVFDRPVPSPDGARFATASIDLLRCEGRNQLDVWRITGEKPVREWSVASSDCGNESGWGPSDVMWRSADTIAFVRNTLPTDSARRSNGDWDRASGFLVRHAGTWGLELGAARTAAHP
jgi:hypothetical protein